MFPRVIISLVLCTAVTLGAFPAVGMKENLAPASFDSYEITLVDGETLNMRLLSGRIIFDSSRNQKFYVTLSKTKNKRPVKTFTVSGGTFDVEVASLMDEDVIYDVTIAYDAYGMSVNTGDNMIFKRGNNVYFWQSDNYEYNVEACRELWTDEQSLKECLEPQNDIECDDPVLIGYSNRICEGAQDDWEKAFRIYKFISSEMAYDKKAADSYASGYQDSAVDVIRSGKAICEGFSNAFAALCRAQGIPAVVEFGIGFADYKEMTTREPTVYDYADHAWAAVYLGGKWLFVDPTYDMSRYYYGPNDIRIYEESTRFYLLPLESFSNDHKIYDADTRHGVPAAGYCGNGTKNAQFEITRDGVCHITGSGTIKMPAGVTGFSKVVFEEGSEITGLANGCFQDNDLLTTVRLPDTITKIGDYAFATCEDLQYVYIPSGVESIGDRAFYGCDELSYVSVPQMIKSIGDEAFEMCPRLYIVMPHFKSGFSDRYKMQPMCIKYRT
ncbi:MAG: leucine-rich repeat protein [Saccharofermentans sp.]|nr:leucine-rich repeat protein [Saccharofermentans sp.]